MFLLGLWKGNIMTTFQSVFNAGGKDIWLRTPICWDVLLGITGEVSSFLNRYGTQCYFMVHEPTSEQLMENYVRTGGLQRFFDKIRIPRSETV